MSTLDILRQAALMIAKIHELYRDGKLTLAERETAVAEEIRWAHDEMLKIQQRPFPAATD